MYFRILMYPKFQKFNISKTTKLDRHQRTDNNAERDQKGAEYIWSVFPRPVKFAALSS